MKIKTLIPMVAVAIAAIVPATVSAHGAPPPPPPPGVHLRPGMMWCDKCGGSGTHGRTWYGWRKTCRKCGGSGMMPRPLPPPPPPRPHHAVRPSAPGPAHPPHHAAPAPTPVRPQPPRPHDARRDPPRR